MITNKHASRKTEDAQRANVLKQKKTIANGLTESSMPIAVSQIFSCVSHRSIVVFSTDELICAKDLTPVSTEDAPDIHKPAQLPSCFSRTPINISGGRNFLCVSHARGKTNTKPNLNYSSTYLKIPHTGKSQLVKKIHFFSFLCN